MEKEIAQSKEESKLNAYEGRPYSIEHNEIPEPDPIERETGRVHKQHPVTIKLEEEWRAEEKRDIEEGRRLEAERETEEEKRIEDTIETKEADKSPTFYLMHCKRTENRKYRDGKEELPRVEQYERQTISLDPENFIEVMKEKMRKYKRNRARIGGTPQKNQADGGRDHNRRNKDQLTERLIKLRELGCGEQLETRSEQLPWYCSDTKRGRQFHNLRVSEEYLNTHNEGEEALEQMDKLGIAYDLWIGEGLGQIRR
jgi:hypothetical protein